MAAPLAGAGENKRKRSAFEAWMDQHGIEHALCEIHQFKSTGRGVRAAQAIAAKTTVLQVWSSVHHQHPNLVGCLDRCYRFQ